MVSEKNFSTMIDATEVALKNLREAEATVETMRQDLEESQSHRNVLRLDFEAAIELLVRVRHGIGPRGEIFKTLEDDVKKFLSTQDPD